MASCGLSVLRGAAVCVPAALLTCGCGAAGLASSILTGTEFSLRLLKLQEDDTAGGGGGASDREKVNAQMIAFADTFLDQLPEKIEDAPPGGKEKSPLERFFERELGQCKAVLKMLRSDLTDLKLVAQGEMKSTNRSRELLAAVNKVQRRAANELTAPPPRVWAAGASS